MNKTCTFIIGAGFSVPIGLPTMLTKEMGNGELLDQTEPNAPHEANLLMLDITKAQTRLGWTPRLSTSEAIALTADWYKRYQSEDVYSLCVEEIKKFES